MNSSLLISIEFWLDAFGAFTNGYQNK